MLHEVVVRVPNVRSRGYELIKVEVEANTGDEAALAAWQAVPHANAVLTCTPVSPRVVSVRALDPQIEAMPQVSEKDVIYYQNGKPVTAADIEEESAA